MEPRYKEEAAELLVDVLLKDPDYGAIRAVKAAVSGN